MVKLLVLVLNASFCLKVVFCSEDTQHVAMTEGSTCMGMNEA